MNTPAGSPPKHSEPKRPTSASWPTPSASKSTNAPNAAAADCIHEAHFPRIKRLADFDFDAAPTINPATIATLAAGGYLDAGEPVVLLGDSGTGKTHLLIGLGVAACEQGRRVRYTTCAQLVNELVEAADERRLARLVARYGRFDLALRRRARLRQTRQPRRRAAVPGPHRTRGEDLGRRRLATSPSANGARSSPTPASSPPSSTALTFNAHIIETGTDSYRLRISRTRRRTTRRG